MPDRDPLTVDLLERWELFGAHWRAAEISAGRLRVELYTCTDELVEVRETRDRAVVDFVRSRSGAQKDR